MGFIGRLKELSEYNRKIDEKKKEIEDCTRSVESMTANLKQLQEFIVKAKREQEDAILLRNAELRKTEEQQKNMIAQYADQLSKTTDQLSQTKTEFEQLRNELRKAKQEQKDAENKVIRAENTLRLLKASTTKAKHNLNSLGALTPATYNEIQRLVPHNELHLHTYDSPSLRQMSKDLNKQITDALKRYEKNFVTKTNKALYQLMTLTLRAEMQNILYALSYSRLDKSKADLKTILNKCYHIAVDGSPGMVTTLQAFVSEIEVLFEKSIEIEYAYYTKREQEKAEQQALRAQMRQEAEERKALEREREKIEKEEAKYRDEISRVEQQLSQCQDQETIQQLKAKIIELTKQLNAVEETKESIINRQNGKAGCVYIISNLGSFGPNVFKVGMTRRSEPMDRIRELGDASVPFRFDVHSFIFSNDAVALETELHRRMEPYRKNKINYRKEFFEISIDEIEKLVYEIDPTAEFNRTMVALEYNRGKELAEARES